MWGVVPCLRRVLVVWLLAVAALLVWVSVAGGVQPYDAYESVVARDGPVAQFRFGDVAGSESLADSAGEGSPTATNDGIVLGGAGPFGGSSAGSFGGSAFAGLSANPLLGDQVFTVEAWVYWDGSSYDEPIFDLGSGAEDFMVLTPSSSAPKHPMLFEIHTGAGTVSLTAGKLKANSWEYVAVTETAAGLLRLYVDGQPVAELAEASLSPASLGESAGQAYLGRSVVSGEGAPPSFEGALSNVAFYASALSAGQVEEHFNDAEFPVNTEAPSISGTAREGKVLKAKQGIWTGLAPITFEYEWQRCEAPGDCPAIEDAVGSSYEPTSEDVGHKLRVQVEASNTAGDGSATSAETAVVEPAKPSNVALPVISGEPWVLHQLSVNEGTWTGTPPISYSYQWELCDESGQGCSAIPGETEPTYTPSLFAGGSTVRAKVTAENSVGSKSVQSEPLGPLTAGPPQDIEAPTVSGTAEEGQTLTATTGNWLGEQPITYAYRWQRYDSEHEQWTNIPEATGSTYTLTAADLGTTVRVTVTATNSDGAAEASSEATASVEGAELRNVSPPEIAGVDRAGWTLSATTGTWAGPDGITYEYEWLRCKSAEDCEAASSVSAATYVLQRADVGDGMRLKVTASNGTL